MIRETFYRVDVRLIRALAEAFASANAPLRSNRRRVTLTVAVVMLFVLAIAVWWPPVIRTSRYFSLIDAFDRATAIAPADRGNRTSEWDVQLRIDDRVRATVRGRNFIDVISLMYSDESEARKLYTYVDYSNPIAVRRAGDVMYVYWVETLFRSEYWLLAYDLRARKEVERRRIDPKDLPHGLTSLALQPPMDIRLPIVAAEERREKVFAQIRRPVFSPGNAVRWRRVARLSRTRACANWRAVRDRSDA